MRTLIALGLMLTIASAGCAANGNDEPGVATAGSGAPTAAASQSAAAADDPDAPLKFSKCMREQGITWFPDPDNSGRMGIHVPESQNKDEFDAAMKACRQWAPDGGQRRQPSAEEMERGRQMAQCMRENGVPNFPDPNADGSVQLDKDKVGSGPGDPTFDKAEKVCAKYLPDGGKQQKREAGVTQGKSA
ncbi:MAG TPA: hypothetical protein VGB74_20765 [Actinoplanes sp.]|jgi:hypothetical protein